jgi:AGZA family xanthine/uracil permease-like MFS transporter
VNLTQTGSEQIWKKEILAGVTTFFTMSYIVVVNPTILSTAGTGMPFSGVLTATVMLSFLMTLFMGLYARLPFAVAPGMGINAFFTFSLILGKNIPWPTALGVVFWSGVLFLILSATPFRTKVALAIPAHLRIAASVGIGFFLTFIGLKGMGIVVSDPVTSVKLGHLGLPSALAVGGLFVMVFLMRKKSPLAFLGGIVFITVAAAFCGLIKQPESLFSSPDFSSTFFKFDPLDALKLSLAPAILSILLTDLFDSLSTLVGVSTATGLVDEKGVPLRLKEGLIVDAVATLSGGLFGTSPGTAYIESAAGIEVGGRTGLTSVVTALCFLPCLFLAPLVILVPAYATGPVLVLVGSMMFRNIGSVNFDKMEESLPAFLTMILIPLTFSIATGMLWGFLMHVILYTTVGRGRELSKTMWSVAALSAVLLVLEAM